MVIQCFFNNSSRLLEQKAYSLDTMSHQIPRNLRQYLFTFCINNLYKYPTMRFQPRLSVNCDYKVIQNIKHTIFDAQSKINGKTFGYIRLF